MYNPETLDTTDLTAELPVQPEVLQASDTPEEPKIHVLVDGERLCIDSAVKRAAETYGVAFPTSAIQRHANRVREAIQSAARVGLTGTVGVRGFLFQIDHQKADNIGAEAL